MDSDPVEGDGIEIAVLWYYEFVAPVAIIERGGERGGERERSDECKCIEYI